MKNYILPKKSLQYFIFTESETSSLFDETRNTKEPLKKQIEDINMKNNEIFSIIRIGTYKQYEKSIAGVDIDCCNEYKQNLLQEAIASCKNDIAKDLINRNIDL